MIPTSRRALAGYALLFFILAANVMFYGRNSVYVAENQQLRLENARLRRLSESQSDNEVLFVSRGETDAPVRENTFKETSSSDNSGVFDRRIPTSRDLDRKFVVDAAFIDKFQQDVTILIFNNGLIDCLTSQIATIRKSLKRISIMVATTSLDVQAKTHKHVDIFVISSEGKAFNTMIARVKTKYFLYLTEGASIAEFSSDNSIAWLYHALNNVPELDFVGGSYLRYDASSKYRNLDVQCYRHKICYWVFEQRYEYQYSVGDMMVCEETSSSFMARTEMRTKFPKFDEDIATMVTTDFFFRVRNKAVVGLRPEVFFEVAKQCTMKPRTNAEEAQLRAPFLVKHDLIRTVDSYGNKYDMPPSITHQSKFVYHTMGGFNIVTMIEMLKSLLLLTDDFFTSHNITYWVDSGVALGGIKMRDVLPWDTGDIDIGYYGDWSRVLADFKKFCAARKATCVFRLESSNGGKEILLEHVYKMGASTMFFHSGKPPPASEFMLMRIHGRGIPVRKNVFHHFRTDYRIHYLQHWDHGKQGMMSCQRPGHHACVPKQFAHGAGHWRDYYCDS